MIYNECLRAGRLNSHAEPQLQKAARTSTQNPLALSLFIHIASNLDALVSSILETANQKVGISRAEE